MDFTRWAPKFFQAHLRGAHVPWQPLTCWLHQTGLTHLWLFAWDFPPEISFPSVHAQSNLTVLFFKLTFIELLPWAMNCTRILIDSGFSLCNNPAKQALFCRWGNWGSRKSNWPAPSLRASMMIKLGFEPRCVFGPGFRLLADHSTSQAALHWPAIGGKPPVI